MVICFFGALAVALFFYWDGGFTKVKFLLGGLSRFSLQPDQETYDFEMEYLETLVLRFAAERGQFTVDELYRRVPGMENCERCREHLPVVLDVAVSGSRLLHDVTEDSYFITHHGRALVADAYAHRHDGQSLLPAHEVRYQHGACHMRLLPKRRRR